MRITGDILGGQVYGFVGRVRVPDREADDLLGSGSSANVWTLEFRGGDGYTSEKLASADYLEAVLRSFPAMRIRKVGGCAVLPLGLRAGQAEGIVLSFVLASQLRPNDYVLVETPPNVLREDPCGDYLAREVVLPPELSLSGKVYPDYVGLPASVVCSWRAGSNGGGDELLLTNTAPMGSEPVPAAAYLISFRVRLPAAGAPTAAAEAAHLWRVGSFREGAMLDAPCELEKPFRFLEAQTALAAASVHSSRRAMDAEPLMLLAFRLASSVAAPVVVTLRAPFGFRLRDFSCGSHLTLSLPDPPEGHSNLPAGSGDALCTAGGGQGDLPLPSFAPDAPQPAPLLEGVLSFHVPGMALAAGTDYVLGVSLVAPIGTPWSNLWHMAINGNVGLFAGLDLQRFASMTKHTIHKNKANN